MVYNPQNERANLACILILAGAGKLAGHVFSCLGARLGSMSQKRSPPKSPSKSLHGLRIQREKKQHCVEEVRSFLNKLG